MSRLVVGVVVVVAFLASAVSAGAVTIEEGPNKATTPKFEWDFGDPGLNVEWVDGLKWKGAASGTFGPTWPLPPG